MEQNQCKFSPYKHLSKKEAAPSWAKTTSLQSNGLQWSTSFKANGPQEIPRMSQKPNTNLENLSWTRETLSLGNDTSPMDYCRWTVAAFCQRVQWRGRKDGNKQLKRQQVVQKQTPDEIYKSYALVPSNLCRWMRTSQNFSKASMLGDTSCRQANVSGSKSGARKTKNTLTFAFVCIHLSGFHLETRV